MAIGEIAAGLAIATQLTNSALEFLKNAQQVSQLTANAQAEGRGTYTEEEWAIITGLDDAARKALVDAIAEAEAEGS